MIKHYERKATLKIARRTLGHRLLTRLRIYKNYGRCIFGILPNLRDKSIITNMNCIDEHKCISYLGSKEEINISLDLIDGYAMDDYDFSVEAYCSSLRKQTFGKRDARRVDANNYKIIVDTNVIGVGDIKIRVVARIPNIEYPDGYRDAVTYLDPNVTVVR